MGYRVVMETLCFAVKIFLLQSTKFLLKLCTPHTNTSSIEKPKEICPLKNPKTTDDTLCGHKLRYFHLYQISNSLVKGNLSSYSYFFQRHQTKSETGAKMKSKRYGNLHNSPITNSLFPLAGDRCRQESTEVQAGTSGAKSLCHSRPAP